MQPKDCISSTLSPETLKELFGEERLDEMQNSGVVQALLEDIDNIKKAYDEGAFDKAEMNKKLTEFIEETAFQAEARAKILAADKINSTKLRAHLKSPSFKENPVEGARSYITRGVVVGNNSRNSLQYRQSAMVEMYVDMLDHTLTENNMRHVFTEGHEALEIELAKAYEDVSFTGPRPKDYVAPTYSPGIVETAMGMKTLNDKMYKDMIDAGIPVRYKESRLTLQTHDRDKIEAMGKEAWITLVKQLKPNRKQMGTKAYTQKGYEEALSQMYDDILQGKHSHVELDGSLNNVPAGADPLNYTVGSSRMGARALNFSPENTIKYNKKAGVYSTLGATIFADIKKTANRTSLFEMFGDNPQKTLNQTLMFTIADLKANGKTKLAQDLEAASPNIRAQLTTVSGANAIPANEGWAKLAMNVTSWEQVSKLTYVGVRGAFSNFANMYAMFRTQNGDSMGDALFKSTLGNFGGVKGAFKKSYTKRAGDMMKILQGNIQREHLGNSFTGFSSKMATRSQMLNGQDFINHLYRDTFTMDTMKVWGEASSKSFDKLNPQQQAALLSFGVGKADWELFKHITKELPDGSKAVDINGIQRERLIPGEEIDKVIAAKGIKISHQKYLTDLELNMRSYFKELGDIVTTTAGARENAAMKFGLQRGTPERAALDILLNFKTFTAGAINNIRLAKNSSFDAGALAQGVVRQQGNNYHILGELFFLGAVGAYFGDSLIRLGTGREVEDPKNVGTWLNAMSKSSVGGMYLDAFTNDWNNPRWGKQAASATLLGPTFGQIAPLYSMIAGGKQALFSGDEDVAVKNLKEMGKEATQLVRNYIPFQQAVGVKQALDWAQWDVINEAMYEGSAAKYEQKKAQEKLQKLLDEESE